MDVSVMIEGQAGLNWERWRAVAGAVEAGPFAGLFRSDHFTGMTGPPDDALEMVVSLTWLAAATERIAFGSLVPPVSFRDPVMHARQGLHLASLSGGRYRHGIGAGWQEREHAAFGYDLGDMRTRFDRFEEAVELTALLLRSGEPVTFEGRSFRVRDAVLLPRPAVPPPLVIGGNGPRRTLPLAARFADEWNATFTPPADYRERNERFDGLVKEAGRDPGEVRRSMMTGLFFGADTAALEARTAHLRDREGFAGRDLDGIVAELRARGVVAGTAETVGESLDAFAEAGCQELMVQWLALDDLDGLNAFAEAVAARG